MKTKSLIAALVCALATTTAQARPREVSTADIPESIITPDSVETRLGHAQIP